MLVVIICIAIGVFGVYVAYSIDKDKSYPYQDTKEDYNVKLGPEPDANWPFPKDMP